MVDVVTTDSDHDNDHDLAKLWDKYGISALVTFFIYNLTPVQSFEPQNSGARSEVHL